jgi:hypothetical protein
MAERGKTCAECGLPLKIFSGLTIDGDTYHDFCWGTRGKTAPKAHPMWKP